MDDTLAFRTSLLHAYPAVSVYASLLDMHVYVFRRAVMDLLVQRREQISSVREELVPYLVKCQTSRELFEREEMEEFVEQSPFRLSDATISGDPKGKLARLKSLRFILYNSRCYSRIN
jgi:hypothetical protein